MSKQDERLRDVEEAIKHVQAGNRQFALVHLERLRSSYLIELSPKTETESWKI